MLDGGGEGDGQHVEDGGHVENGLGKGAFGQGRRPGNLEPGGFPDRGEIDDAHGERDEVADDDAAEHGDETEEFLAVHHGGHGGQQRAGGDENGPAVGGAAVEAARHADGDGRELEADDHDDGAGDDGRQVAVEQFASSDPRHGAEDQIDQSRAEERAGGGAGAELFHRELDGRDECERTGQEDRHGAAGERVEQQRAGAGGEEGDGRIEPRQQRHEHQRAERHEQHLDAQHEFPSRRHRIHRRFLLMAGNLPGVGVEPT